MNTQEQSFTMDLQAEIDRLTKENAELNNLASLKLSRSWIKELQAEIDRLRKENVRLTGEHRQTYALLLCKLRDKEAENARLAAALDHTACLEERFSTIRAGHLPECPCERCMLARELLRDSAILRKLIPERGGAEL